MSSGPLVGWGLALRLGQPLGQDPDHLRRCFGPYLGPRVRQVVLHGGVREAEPVGGFLLRPGAEDGGHNDELTICGASGGAAVPHASRLAAASHGCVPRLGDLLRGRAPVLGDRGTRWYSDVGSERVLEAPSTRGAPLILG